ncbi:protein downstream neighbor of Son isoform X2 [Octopus bimaculoides]|nr:protein downstream neighbor of Son isoform X2 [Octopus bimaculoides]
MKLRRKKKRLLENENSSLRKRLKLDDLSNRNDQISPCASLSSFYQHKNPFRRNHSTPVRTISSTTEEIRPKTNSIRLFDTLDTSETNNVKDFRSKTTDHGIHHLLSKDSCKAKRNEDCAERVSDVSNVTKKEDFCQDIPFDWSLKLKMRFISLSFDWCKNLRSSEEAEGVSNYLASQLPETTPSANLKKLPENSWRSHFHRETLYWVHPNLPWVKLFPRITHEKSSNSINLGDQVYSSLLSDWSESFLSAFGQLRSGYCPYLYVCTHQFTVLFKRMKTSKNDSTLSAVLTPTTRGLREALKKEGIEFKMPCNPKGTERTSLESEDSNISGGPVSRNSSISSHNSSVDDDGDDDGDIDGEADLFEEQENIVPSSDPEELKRNFQSNGEIEEEEEDGFIADEGAAVWLESIGLDKKNFPSLNPNKVRLHREGFKQIDCRPESVIVLDQDVDVQALFNFLLNWRACIAAVGPQHGIPPTILSPNAFKGATLKSLKVKHSTALQKDRQKISVLEMAGPILPTHVQRLVKLICQTQDQNFSLSLHTHEPTSALNVRMTDASLNQPPSKCSNNKVGSAFSSTSLVSAFKHTVSDVTCTPDGFVWSR